MKKRFPFWTLGLLGIILLILVPVLYFLPSAKISLPRTPQPICPKSLCMWITRTSSKANSKPDRMSPAPAWNATQMRQRR